MAAAGGTPSNGGCTMGGRLLKLRCVAGCPPVDVAAVEPHPVKTPDNASISTNFTNEVMMAWSV